MPSLVLLHTNDMHGRLAAEAAARIRAEKSRDPNTLLVDAGDALRAGNLGVPLASETVLRHMNTAGYDLMAAGNRETHLWPWALRAKLRQAAFPVLCANVTGPGVAAGDPVARTPAELRALARSEALYRPYVIVRIPNNLRVGIFGLTVPMVTREMAARHFSSYLFRDPVETARDLVPLLARNADLVVGVLHLGLGRDCEIAREVPGIDLLVGGHTHDLLPEPVVVGRTVVLQAGSYARYLGRVEVSVEAAG
ncbi:MAG TPA: hypothetical protein PLU39_13485, partial [Armatimonadota bacterium]|nr:hypothetical protein [Armatimonadota bacterium]